jgi:queuine tRNA-ribosyltransferase
MDKPFFELLHEDSATQARLGVMHTDHGDIETPIFMPVGTQASVKTLDQTDLQNIDAQIILGNTYHLHLRPGEAVLDAQGGLHKFMNWNRPILTDSGGFQVFSLGIQREKRPSSAKVTVSKPGTKEQGKLVSIDDDGVTFTSHIDGSKHRFTPESAIQTQHQIGADIIMAFDECTPDDATPEYARKALNRTHAWAKRCIDEHQKNISHHGYRQFLFGIIQGALHRDLREESAKFIADLPFDGIAIGGESIGYNMTATAEIMDWVNPLIPKNKPHYAMGVGLSPLDLLIAIEHGVDMFDCVAPTRLARHGMLYTKDSAKKHRLNITNGAYANDTTPIDPTCSCSTCQNYTRSYIHHLFDADELTALRLASIHNLSFLLNLMAETKNAIKNNQFLKLKKSWE